MEELTADERTVKAWSDIVNREGPSRVSVERAHLANLVGIAKRGVTATPSEWQNVAGRIWAVDVDPIDVMDQQLDMLERLWDVENGNAHVEIWRDGSEYPWHITCVLVADEWSDDNDEQVTVAETRRTTYSGDTLAEAIEHAWRRHRGPVICSACDGAGDRPATDDEIAAAKAAGRVLAVQVSGDGRGNRTETTLVPCDACSDGLGYVLTLPKPDEVPSC